MEFLSVSVATDANGVVWVEGEVPPSLVEVALGNPEPEVVMSPFESGQNAPTPAIVGYAFLVKRK
ncbi:hypothetical protein [Saltatorellus ferox]|uniref:hypothetical protein n=1 Tax=Saltatorellus ferox TaxID=2528018 RepID=UPI003AF38F5D